MSITRNRSRRGALSALALLAALGGQAMAQTQAPPPQALTGRPVGQPAAAGLGTHVQRLAAARAELADCAAGGLAACRSVHEKWSQAQGRSGRAEMDAALARCESAPATACRAYADAAGRSVEVWGDPHVNERE